MKFIFVYPLIIFLVIYFKDTIEKKDREISKLKKTIEELKAAGNITNTEVQNKIKNDAPVQEVMHHCSKCGKEITGNLEYCTECEAIIQEEKKQEELRMQEERKRDYEERKRIAKQREEETKNSLILIIGSFLIVLAAVVFLMGTWNTINNVVKTVVLALGIALFLGGSKVAETKLKIEKTAKTFFYIAMAYFPLFLLSISVLGLFGEYLSIYGDGNLLYLGLSSLLTAIVYYGFYKSKKEKMLFFGSLLAQAGSIVLLTIMIAGMLEIVLINLLLYNIVLIAVLSLKENRIISDDIFSIIPFITCFLSVLLLFADNILVTLVFLLLAVNFGIINKRFKSNPIIPYFLIGSIFMCGLYTIYQVTKSFTIQLQYIADLAFLFAAYFVIQLKANKNEKLQDAVYLLFGIFDFILFFTMFLHPEEDRIPLFAFTLVGMGVSILSHKLVTKNIKDIIEVVFPLLSLVTGFLVIAKIAIAFDLANNVITHLLMIYSLVYFILGEISLIKNIQIKKVWFIISNIITGIVFVFSILQFIPNIGQYIAELLLLTLMYALMFYKRKQKAFKYITYISFTFLLYAVANIIKPIGLDIYYYVPMIVSMIIILLEDKFSNLKDDYSIVISDIFKVIAYFNLFKAAELATPIGCIYSVFLIVINRKYINTQRMYDDVIPLIGIVPVILSNVSLTNEVIVALLGAAIGALTLYSITQKKISIYTIASGGYLMILSNYMESTMIFKIIFITWAFVLWYFFTDEKQKDVFKFLGTIGILTLYMELIKEIELDKIIVFNYMGIIITDIFIMRKIIYKYIKDFEILEAISLAILYLIPISQYADEIDGMMFVALIVAILVFSYVKKYGMIFMISGAAIVINALLLTREFWISIPWWLYLMIVGGFLIAFAGTNEARQNKSISITGKIKDIKEKIDGR